MTVGHHFGSQPLSRMPILRRKLGSSVKNTCTIYLVDYRLHLFSARLSNKAAIGVISSGVIAQRHSQRCGWFLSFLKVHSVHGHFSSYFHVPLPNFICGVAIKLKPVAKASEYSRRIFEEATLEACDNCKMMMKHARITYDDWYHQGTSTSSRNPVGLAFIHLWIWSINLTHI